MLTFPSFLYIIFFSITYIWYLCRMTDLNTGHGFLSCLSQNFLIFSLCFNTTLLAKSDRLRQLACSQAQLSVWQIDSYMDNAVAMTRNSMTSAVWQLWIFPSLDNVNNTPLQSTIVMWVILFRFQGLSKGIFIMFIRVWYLCSLTHLSTFLFPLALLHWPDHHQL